MIKSLLKKIQNIFKIKKEVLFNFSKSEYIKCKFNPSYFVDTYIDRILFKDDQRLVIQGFLNNQYSVLKAPRASGKTLLIALFSIHQAIFNENYSINILGLSQHHDSYIRVLILDFLKPWANFYSTPSQKRIVFKNGSCIEFDNRPSADLILADEYAYMPQTRQVFIKNCLKYKSKKFIIASTPKPNDIEFVKIWDEPLFKQFELNYRLKISYDLIKMFNRETYTTEILGDFINSCTD